MLKKWNPVFVLILLLVSCFQMPANRPSDFSLTLQSDSGSLPPQYRHEYVITIGPGNQGQLEYQVGYSPADDSRRRVEDFTLSDDRLDELYAYLDRQGIFTTRWKVRKRLIGGRNSTLIVTAFGREYHLPALVEFSDDQRELAQETMDGVAGFVPETIWAEMDAFQQTYEQSFE